MIFFLAIIATVAYFVLRPKTAQNETATEMSAGEIRVTVQAEAPPAVTEAANVTMVADQPWWMVILNFVKRVLTIGRQIIFALLLTLLIITITYTGAWLLELTTRWIRDKKMPDLKNTMKLPPPWTLIADGFCKCKTIFSKSGNKTPAAGTNTSTGTSKDKKKEGPGFFGFMGKVITFAAIYFILACVLSPRFAVARVYEVYRVATGLTSPRVEEFLNETQPAISKMSPDQLAMAQPAPQQFPWLMEENTRINEGITGSKPRPYKVEYVDSDTVAFRVEMIELATGSTVWLVLYQESRGSFKGWWEFIGKNRTHNVGGRPPWYATKAGPDSFNVFIRNEDSPLFTSYKIYKEKKIFQ